MMDGKAMELLLKAGSDSRAVQVLTVNSNPNERYVVKKGDAYEVLMNDPAPRNHYPESLDSLIKIVTREGEHADMISVWCSSGAVVAVLDDYGKRINRATMKLSHSMPWTTLQQLSRSRPSMLQKQVLRTLRIDLAGCGVPPDVITAVRTINFSKQESGKSEVTPSKESLDRRVLAEVSGAQKLPESFVVTLPIYENPGESALADVTVLLEVEPAEGTFCLIPLIHEMQRAVEAHQEEILMKLGCALGDMPNVAVFRGCP
jgi:hypothetical protein